jgi:hypothetical protein
LGERGSFQRLKLDELFVLLPLFHFHRGHLRKFGNLARASKLTGAAPGNRQGAPIPVVRIVEGVNELCKAARFIAVRARAHHTC